MKTGCLLVVVALLAGNVSGSDSPTEAPTLSPPDWYMRGTHGWNWDDTVPMIFKEINTDNNVVYTTELELTAGGEFKYADENFNWPNQIGICPDIQNPESEGPESGASSWNLCGNGGDDFGGNSVKPTNIIPGLYFVELIITCGSARVSNPCDGDDWWNMVATVSITPTTGSGAISCILSCTDSPSLSPSEAPTEETNSPSMSPTSMSPTTAPSSSPTATPSSSPIALQVSGAHHVGVCMMWAAVTTALILF